MSCIIILELLFKGDLKIFKSLSPIPGLLRCWMWGVWDAVLVKHFLSGPQITFGELLVKMLFGSLILRILKIFSIGCHYCKFLLIEKLKLCMGHWAIWKYLQHCVLFLLFSWNFMYYCSPNLSCLYSSSIGLLHLPNIELDSRNA